jgi:hypothetical protein
MPITLASEYFSLLKCPALNTVSDAKNRVGPVEDTIHNIVNGLEPPVTFARNRTNGISAAQTNLLGALAIVRIFSRENCAEYRCSHSTTISADRWPDDVRLSDIEPLFTCHACGKKGAAGWPRSPVCHHCVSREPLAEFPG